MYIISYIEFSDCSIAPRYRTVVVNENDVNWFIRQPNRRNITILWTANIVEEQYDALVRLGY